MSRMETTRRRLFLFPPQNLTLTKNVECDIVHSFKFYISPAPLFIYHRWSFPDARKSRGSRICKSPGWVLQSWLTVDFAENFKTTNSSEVFSFFVYFLFLFFSQTSFPFSRTFNTPPPHTHTPPTPRPVHHLTVQNARRLFFTSVVMILFGTSFDPGSSGEPGSGL